MLGNFIERERITTEVQRLKMGEYADMALKNLRDAKLDPSDFTRAEVYLGTGWCECEPGQEPRRVRQEYHARWASRHPIIYVSPDVDAVEIEFNKPGYTSFNTIQVTWDGSKKEERPFEGISFRIPTFGAKMIEFDIPTFVPSEVMDTKDNRELSIYVSKIITHKMGERTEVLIEHVPYYIEV